MSKLPRCEVADCAEPVFYANGPHCLGHIRNPPKKIAAPPADESESSD
jgi:hypothetical protein